MSETPCRDPWMLGGKCSKPGPCPECECFEECDVSFSKLMKKISATPGYYSWERQEADV